MAVFGVTFSFAALLASGSILFFTPKGKVSKATDWDELGLGRKEWSDLHSVLSALFVTFS